MTSARPAMSVALSVDVEDWFHSENVKRVIDRDSWDAQELRVERNTMRILEVLEAQGRRATFFVLGWVADRCPQLVRAIGEAGHEIASHGYAHELVYSLEPGQFRADVVRSKKLLEDLGGKPVRGYRAPCFSITDWAIPILQETGFTYDSSLVPAITHDRYGRLHTAGPTQAISVLRDGFYEIRLSCLRIGERGIPWGGGGYFRLVPLAIWLQGLRAILRSDRCYVFYIHPWEIDPGQPRLAGLQRTNAFRQRVSLERCEGRFAALVAALPWVSISDLIEDRRAGEAQSLEPRERAPPAQARIS